MSKEKKSYPTYTAQEKVGLYSLGILIVFLLAGWSLCYFSFAGEELIHPRLNFAGLIIMLILPGSASLVFALCREISPQSIWQYCQEVWEKFFIYMPLAALIAFFHSSRQGFMPPKITIILALSWIAATFAFYRLNHLLRRLSREDKAETQT